MPDDRPESPEERLREALTRIKTLTDPDREPHSTSSEIETALRDTVLMMRDRMEKAWVIAAAALSTPAGPSPCSNCGGDGVIAKRGPVFPGYAPAPCPDCAPSPREEAVEERRWALHECPKCGYVSCYRPPPVGPSKPRCPEGHRHPPTIMLPAALSAARPSSPTPEETWKDEAAFPHLSGYAARSATPGDDATTKEGR